MAENQIFDKDILKNLPHQKKMKKTKKTETPCICQPVLQSQGLWDCRENKCPMFQDKYLFQDKYSETQKENEE